MMNQIFMCDLARSFWFLLIESNTCRQVKAQHWLCRDEQSELRHTTAENGGTTIASAFQYLIIASRYGQGR